ncbi:MAG: fumarate hydratase [Treponemataceae bacterium]|nr:fumarate hydratase [Treponemataceae bacterium]
MELQNAIEKAFQHTSFERIPPPPEAEGSLQVSGNFLSVSPALLQYLAREAFYRLSFFLRKSHLDLLKTQWADPHSSENDRIVIRALLENATIAARGVLPLCQDTGTATVLAWKDEGIRTESDDAHWLSEGIREAYEKYYLRSSQVAPRSFFEEYDTGTNLPAQIHIEATPSSGESPRYRFLFVAKGGGSANKTGFFQMPPGILEPLAFERFVREKISALGTAACPPYRLAIVVGGTSPEENLRILKLATTEILDGLPSLEGSPASNINSNTAKTSPSSNFQSPLTSPYPEAPLCFRDVFWERRILEIARETGLGAQFGGSAFALDCRVIRLPRHAASCPISIGVSCSAHRNLLGYIDRRGMWLEQVETQPESYVPAPSLQKESLPSIHLAEGIERVCRRLSELSVGSRLLLSGDLLLARDAAHLRWHRLIEAGKPLPEYLYQYPILYGGPAATPPGKIIGSFGPTTAQRMDSYGEELLSRGIARITLAKGNRASQWREACKKYGGFYLGVIGGVAALIAEQNILACEILDYPELGMEAVRRITVKDLLAFIIIDDKGNDLYAGPATAQ